MINREIDLKEFSILVARFFLEKPRIEEEEEEEEYEEEGLPDVPTDIVVPSDWSGVSPLPSVHGRRLSRDVEKEGKGTGSLTNLEVQMGKLNHTVRKMEHKLDHQKKRLTAMEDEYLEERELVDALHRQLEETEKKLIARRRRAQLAGDEEVNEKEIDGMEKDKKSKAKKKSDDPNKPKKKKKKKIKHDKNHGHYDEERPNKHVHRKKKKMTKKKAKVDFKAFGYRDYKDYRERTKLRRRRQPKRRSFSGMEQPYVKPDRREGRGTPHSWPAKRARDPYASGRDTPNWLRESRNRRATQKGPPGVVNASQEEHGGRRLQKERVRYQKAPAQEDLSSVQGYNLQRLFRVLALPLVIIIAIAIILIVVFVRHKSNGKDSSPQKGSSPQMGRSSKFESLLPNYTKEALNNKRSPQSMALQWFNRDESQGSYEKSRKLQRFALATLYYSTGGSNWTDSTLWLSGSNECGWFTSGGEMMSCTNDSTFVNLELAENNLQGTIPREIELLRELKVINLNDNLGLGGPIPTHIGTLSTLKTLEIKRANLTGSIPTEIAFLTKLNRLDVYENRLSGPIPASISKLSVLSELRLERNDLSNAIPSEIGLMTRLEKLHLHENFLTGAIPSEVGQLVFQKEIFLHLNELSHSIPTEIGRLALLEKLWSDRNQLTGGIPSELGLLMNLEELILFGNRIFGTIPSELSRANSLQRIELVDNSLTGSVPANLCSLLGSPTLQILAVDCIEVSCECNCTCM